MRHFTTISQNIRPTMSGHDTFPIKYGWISKTYAQVKHDSSVSNVFSQDSAIADFGVGKNMLNALRYWSVQTAMLVKQSNKYLNSSAQLLDHVDQSDAATQWLNEFYNAETLLNPQKGLDPYLEEPTTLWLLHWNLATNPNLITFYWFFNINTKPELTREEFFRLLKEFMENHQIDTPSDSTIKKDIECFIQNYATKRRKSSEELELTLDSPLSELGLLSRGSSLTIRALRGKKENLNIHAFVYFLTQFWRVYNSGANTLSLEMATYNECSVGRVFMIDEEVVIGYAEQLQNHNYPIAWVQSAGIRQFQLQHNDLDYLLSLVISNLKKHIYNR